MSLLLASVFRITTQTYTSSVNRGTFHEARNASKSESIFQPTWKRIHLRSRLPWLLSGATPNQKQILAGLADRVVQDGVLIPKSPKETRQVPLLPEALVTFSSILSYLLNRWSLARRANPRVESKPPSSPGKLHARARAHTHGERTRCLPLENTGVLPVKDLLVTGVPPRPGATVFCIADISPTSSPEAAQEEVESETASPGISRASD